MSIGSESGSTLGEPLFISSMFGGGGGGVNRDGGLFNLKKMMVSIVHKEKNEKWKSSGA